MDRGHVEDAPAEPFDPDLLLHQDREGHGDEDPAGDDEEELLFEQHGQGADDAAQRQGAHVAHEDLGGIGVVPEKSHAGAEDPRADHRQFAAARQIGELQVSRIDGVSDDVGEHPVHDHRKGDRDDGQSVQSVGEIHRVGDGHHDEGNEGQIPPAQIEDGILDEGKIEFRGDFRRYRGQAGRQEDQAEAEAENRLEEQLGGLGQAAVAVPVPDLPVIVDESEQGKPDQREQEDHGEAVEQVAPQQHAGEDGRDDQ